MRKQRTLILLLLSGFLLLCVAPSQAQNPASTKKRYKALKKRGKTKNDKIPGYVSPYYAYDDDGDGVPNYRDKCLNTPKGERVTTFGCPPDTDFDGVYDFEDSCINEKGPRENRGCPYADRDKDGINDHLDACPDTPGLREYDGCPDTDKDGLPDNKDKCPNEPGPKANQGCPTLLADQDKDGVPDLDDVCPKTPGVKENRGCPKLKKEEEEALKKAFENLLFETNKDVILSSSFNSLNELAKVMKKYPDSKLHLEGHTDNVGDDAKNLDLSQRRAAAVMNYLVKQGLSQYRISSEGFGETRPVASNDTEDGRKLNRRVEMVIKYE